MPEPKLASKEMQQLRAKFKPGFTLEQSGDGFRILDPEGRPVRRDRKPYILHSTPHGGRQTLNTEHDLISLGVIGGQERERKFTITPQERQRRRERAIELNRTRAEERQKEADAFYERVYPLFSKLGPLEREEGEAYTGVGADISRVAAMLWDDPENPVEPDNLRSNLFRVMKRQPVEKRHEQVWIRLAEELEAHADRNGDMVEHFYELVRQARGLPSSIVREKPQALGEDEWPFEVRLLPLEALMVDGSYQRPVAWAFVRRGAASFDPSLVGTLDVSERRRKTVFAVMDGQQRLEMVKLVGKTSVYASVYRGLDIAAEARFFIHKNNDQKYMHPYYTYRAQLLAGDKETIAIDEVVTKLGYRVSITAPRATVEDRNRIAAIAALRMTYRRKRPDGRSALTETMQVLREASFGQPGAQSGIAIRGLSRLLERFAADQLDLSRLVSVLADEQVDNLVQMARGRSRSSGSAEQAFSEILSELYNKGLPRAERLYL